MERIRTSARRLLRNIFRTGLFENPYLIPEESAKVVGCAEYMAKGFEAQVKSIVMVKNHANALPLKEAKNTKVYIPKRFYPDHKSFWGSVIPADTITPVKPEQADKYFTNVNSAEEADVAIVFIDSPNSGWGHNLGEALSGNLGKSKEPLIAMLKGYGVEVPAGKEDAFLKEYIQREYAGANNFFIPAGSKVSAPGNGYYPISLQYDDYVAEYAREKSLGQGDPFERVANRSYKGKGVRTYNKPDMLLVQEMRERLGKDKKLIVVVNTSNPFVLSEIEPYADAILITFTIQKQAILEVIDGTYEPSGLLPFQMPLDMKTVELQAEDTPRDMECYKDADGNVYDFAYGLNWNGVINDERTNKYK